MATTNVTTAAETNLSKSANFARVREIEFVELFQGDIRKLVSTWNYKKNTEGIRISS